MSLATIDRNTNGVPMPYGADPVASSPLMTLDDVWQMAGHVAKSGMFACKTPEQAFALMMLCQSEGLHPMQAVRRFHIVQNRPCMRSDAAQAEFQKRGGRIRPIKRDAREARAVFSHPEYLPDGMEIGVTFEQYKQAGLTGKDNWKNFPDDMLWARLVTKGIRTVYPGIIAGIYSPEEIEDVEYLESSAGRHATIDAEAVRQIVSSDHPIPGQPDGPDTRPYHLVVSDAFKAAPCEWEAKDFHRHLVALAINQGHADGPFPETGKEAVKVLTKVYASHRQWTREQLAAFLTAQKEPATASPVEPSSDDLDPDIDLPDEPGSDG